MSDRRRERLVRHRDAVRELRYMKLEHEDGHGDREDPVDERLDPVRRKSGEHLVFSSLFLLHGKQRSHCASPAASVPDAA